MPLAQAPRSVLWVHFLRGAEAFGHPRKARDLLERGELAETFAGWEHALLDEAGTLPDGRPVAALVALAPGHTTGAAPPGRAAAPVAPGDTVRCSAAATRPGAAAGVHPPLPHAPGVRRAARGRPGLQVLARRQQAAAGDVEGGGLRAGGHRIQPRLTSRSEKEGLRGGQAVRCNLLCLRHRALGRVNLLLRRRAGAQLPSRHHPAQFAKIEDQLVGSAECGELSSSTGRSPTRPRGQASPHGGVSRGRKTTPIPDPCERPATARGERWRSGGLA
eukprot:CAMPEP_0183804916 /NCGR_PEP_ID=MMETSP0803_2-20130417/36142_1 /TAXON_ID=195967 /ORGANISM="Crustomastix stigmata, Strain CCMP3273" /LENGTH=274 /DNA_ID=CAMNT_0026049667 /DNA_START=23 /DNA_END=842 /DNA_ORIENTATION=+